MAPYLSFESHSLYSVVDCMSFRRVPLKLNRKLCAAFMSLVLCPLQGRRSLEAQERALPILAIDFFGYGGIDLSQVRAHLPVHVGQSFSTLAEERSHSPEIRAMILQTLGKPVSSLSNVEVEEGYLIYIGLPGSTLHKFQPVAAPTGSIQLPEEAKALYARQLEQLPKAIAAGAAEDDSQGYALSSFADLRRAELDAHSYATKNESLIRSVLAKSSEKEDRVAAANLLSYADPSLEQLRSLAEACYDSDPLVRNNTIRAIGVVVSAKPGLGSQLPLTPFVQMLSSDSWTDRNKAGFVLDALTKSRDPKVLAQLLDQALAPLTEMARWHDYGHAGSFRLILGRIAGIDEATLEAEAKDAAKVDSIIAAAQENRR